MCKYKHWCPICTRKQLIFFSRQTIRNMKTVYKSIFRCNVCNNYFYKEGKDNYVLINLKQLQEMKN
jgi:hypothetical protein